MEPPIDTPLPLHGYIRSLPDKYVGELWAKIRAPFWPCWPFREPDKWYRVPVWGQVADGQPHEHAVRSFLYNKFPLHGQGYTYIAWRNVQYSIDNDRPREGLIISPQPFDGRKESL